MKMESLEFPQWWKEFVKYHEKKNDNGKSMMNDLKWTLNGYSVKKRKSFINHLIAEKELEIAAELIPKYGGICQKVRLRLALLGNLIFTRK
jgi:hypothetical protein